MLFTCGPGFYFLRDMCCRRKVTSCRCLAVIPCILVSCWPTWKTWQLYHPSSACQMALRNLFVFCWSFWDLSHSSMQCMHGSTGPLLMVWALWVLMGLRQSLEQRRMMVWALLVFMGLRQMRLEQRRTRLMVWMGLRQMRLEQRRTRMCWQPLVLLLPHQGLLAPTCMSVMCSICVLRLLVYNSWKGFSASEIYLVCANFSLLPTYCPCCHIAVSLYIAPLAQLMYPYSCPTSIEMVSILQKACLWQIVVCLFSLLPNACLLIFPFAQLFFPYLPSCQENGCCCSYLSESHMGIYMHASYIYIQKRLGWKVPNPNAATYFHHWALEVVFLHSAMWQVHGWQWLSFFQLYARGPSLPLRGHLQPGCSVQEGWFAVYIPIGRVARERVPLLATWGRGGLCFKHPKADQVSCDEKASSCFCKGHQKKACSCFRKQQKSGGQAAFGWGALVGECNPFWTP